MFVDNKFNLFFWFFFLCGGGEESELKYLSNFMEKNLLLKTCGAGRVLCRGEMYQKSI